MKVLVLLCVVLALFVSTPSQSQTLYDDFTGPLLDSSKWFSDYKIGPNISNYMEIGQVIAKGKQFTFNVNGETVKTFTDGDFPAGNIGVTAGTLFDNAGVQIAFDNLKVSEVKP